MADHGCRQLGKFHQTVCDFGQFVDELGQEAALQRLRGGIHAARFHHDDVMSQPAKRMDEFVDMDRLAVARARAMVIQDCQTTDPLLHNLGIFRRSAPALGEHQNAKRLNHD